MKSLCFIPILFFAALYIILSTTACSQSPQKQTISFAGVLFTDVTEGSGFEFSGHGKCIAMADADRDGDLDVFQALVYEPNRLLRKKTGPREIIYYLRQSPGAPAWEVLPEIIGRLLREITCPLPK